METIMAAEVLDLPRVTSDATSSAYARASAMRRIKVLMRHWRRQHVQRRQLAMVLAGTSDPRLVEEAGFSRPAPGILDLWARALLQHRR
jgi:hypothetical protein